MTNDPSLQRINHFIDRDEARKLISAYRELQNELVNPKFERSQKEYGVLPVSEAFNQKAILSILAQDDCVGIRIHYGIKYTQEGENTVPLLVAVLVGVASDGSNIWEQSAVTSTSQTMNVSATARGAERDGVIVEDSQRCPPFGDSSPMP